MVDTTWTNGGGDGKASTAANWSNGIDVGYNVLFDATSTANCTFDYDGELGTFTIAAGYSGTITQSSDMHITGFSQAAGKMDGSATKIIYCCGNFTGNGLNSISPIVNMNGENSFYSSIYNCILRVSANITITQIGTSDLQFKGIFINPNCSLTIAPGKIAFLRYYTGYYGINNDGIIKGTGTLKITLYNSDQNFGKIGNISCPLIFHLHSASAASRTLTFMYNIISTNSVSIISDHASNTLTINTNGHSLTANSITIGTMGILSNSAATDSVVSCASFDSSAGTFTEANTQVILKENGTLKTGAHKFDELVQRDGVITTIGSNITVTNEFDTAGSFVQGAYSITHENPEKRLIAPMINPIVRNPKRSPFLNNIFTRNIELEVI